MRLLAAIGKRLRGLLGLLPVSIQVEVEAVETKPIEEYPKPKLDATGKPVYDDLAWDKSIEQRLDDIEAKIENVMDVVTDTYECMLEVIENQKMKVAE